MECDIGVGELPQTWILVRAFCEGLSMGRPRVFVLLLSFSFLLNLECRVELDPEFLVHRFLLCLQDLTLDLYSYSFSFFLHFPCPTGKHHDVIVKYP